MPSAPTRSCPRRVPSGNGTRRAFSQGQEAYLIRRRSFRSVRNVLGLPAAMLWIDADGSLTCQAALV